MSFNPNIPTTSDFILQSFNQLRANFQAINAAFSNNHSSMSQEADTAGQHTAITFRPQTGNPVTDADQIALFTKIVSGSPNLFLVPNNSQTPIQLTNSSLSTSSESLSQHSFLAGPFIIYGGFFDQPTQGQLVTLTPGTTLIYVDLTVGFYNKPGQSAPATATPTAITGTSFNITFSDVITAVGATFGVYYFAIGLP